MAICNKEGCNDLHGNQCKDLLEIGIEEGDITRMQEVFAGYDREKLELIRSTHQSSLIAGHCVASTIIFNMATEALGRLDGHQ